MSKKLLSTGSGEVSAIEEVELEPFEGTDGNDVIYDDAHTTHYYGLAGDDRLWGDTYSGFERTVDTHIQRLRRKLGGSGSIADHIVTLWGVGYKYERTPSPDSHSE